MKERADRYQSAAEMADELVRVATLPVPAPRAPGLQVDATRTMDSLPVTEGVRGTSSHILVPARPPSGPVILPAPAARGMIRREPAPPALAKPKPSETGTGGGRLSMALLGSALLVLVVMMAITLMSGTFPFLDRKPDLASEASATPDIAVAGVAKDGTAAAPTATSEVTETGQSAADEGTGRTEGRRLTMLSPHGFRRSRRRLTMPGDGTGAV